MKIAYCFLVYHDIVPYSIWNQYFVNQSQENYCVYIHSKYKTNSLLYTFPYQEVPNPIPTIRKSHISIVEATLYLWKNALIDKEVTHIMFLSQNCIPLYPFDKLNTFLGSLPYSMISCIHGNKKERHKQMHPTLQKKIPYTSFVKQQPNMLITREDAELFIQYPMIHFFSNMECPDEHYFINLIMYFFNKKIFMKQTHYCNPDPNKTQAVTFHHLSPKQLKDIQSKGYLFMRKVI